MPSVDPQTRIPFLYHFTDRRNLPLIRQHGGLYPLSDLTARGIEIPAPGSDDSSRAVDRHRKLDQFVHLCFKSNHPMEFVARQQGRISDTIFLQVHASVIHWEGVRFRTDWKDPLIQRRLQQVEKYEIPVPRGIPLELIRNLPNG